MNQVYSCLLHEKEKFLKPLGAKNSVRARKVGTAMDFTNPYVEFIISTILTLLGLVLGLIGLILSFRSYFLSRNRKSITWERVSVTSVKHLKNVRLLFLRIWNSGDVPIVKNDYDGPIKLNFGKGAKVTKVEVVDTRPPGLKEAAAKSLKPDPNYLNKIIITPFLLNAKYLINFKVQLTDFKGVIIPENTTSIFGLYDFFEKRTLAESSKGKLLFYSIASIVGGQGLGLSLQLWLQPFDRFGLILGSLILFSTELLKSFAPAVLLGYLLRWQWKLKSFTPLFTRWLEVSLVLSVINTVLIVTSFQSMRLGLGL